MDKAFAAAGPVRKEAYGAAKPAVASTILVTSRLALAAQLIEIKFVAKTPWAHAVEHLVRFTGCPQQQHRRDIRA
jgi:hypothetical protein